MLLLIRHGETDWNKEGRTNGQTNTSLNERGIVQAKKLSLKLKEYHPDIAHIYSSDLDRAYCTAQETACVLELEITKLPQLKEMKYGEAEGKARNENTIANEKRIEELKLQYPTRKERWDLRLFPEAETYNEVLERAKSALLTIAEAHPGEKIAVFSHGRLIKTILSDILDSEDAPSLPNCAIAYVTYNSENPEKPFAFLKMEN